MGKAEFTTDEYYHIYSRGVDKRVIFNDENDRLRFVQGLYVFNDLNLIDKPFSEGFRETVHRLKGNKRPLVDIVAWCLMPNHYHLLVKQIVDGGITKFTQKYGNSYTKYFNLKNNRTGHLFGSHIQSRHVDSEVYLTHVSRYIHLNSLEIHKPDWKNTGVSIDDAKRFLSGYKWSSLNEYLRGSTVFEPVLNKTLLLDMFDGEIDHYEEFIEDWITKGVPQPLLPALSFD